jgi:Tol biopolymer transport system component
MTTSDRIQRHLPELMADLAAAGTPDYFDDLLQETARIRQRSAWSSLERWLPVDLTLAPVSSRARPLAGLAVFLLVGLLAAAALLAYVGSRPTRLPAPFGPAGNGLMYYSSADGDIYSVDSSGLTPKSIVAGPEVDAGPLPSRDGRRIAFTRKAIGGDQVIVAEADGSGPRALPGTWTDFSEIDWSPDSSRIAIVSSVAGVSSLTVLPVDGSPSMTLPLGMEVHDFWYLPDARFAFVGVKNAAEGTTYGFYVTDTGGANPRAILPPSTVELDWLGMSPSPDGRSLVYHRWRDPDELGRLHVVDIATGVDRPVAVDGTAPGDNYEVAQFSPDGTQLMFIRFMEVGGTRVTVVPATGGRAVSLGPVGASYEMTPIALYAPDGKSILAYYPSTKEVWQLDPSGNGNDRKLNLPVSDVPTWQRVAP